jgi:hypothetical protein
MADLAEYIFGVLRPVKHGDVRSSIARRAPNLTPTPAGIQRREESVVSNLTGGVTITDPKYCSKERCAVEM